MITEARLESLLARFPTLSIGLVGDLFLDRYLMIDPELRELSIETGLEAYQVTGVRNSPGAMGTVTNNLTALGVARLVPVTVVGDDGQAHDLLAGLASMPVDASHVIKDARRLTPTYTKPMRRDAAGQWRELNRLDLRNSAPLARDAEDQLIERISIVHGLTDGLIVTDQVNEDNWGVVTTRVREHLNRLAAEHPEKLVLVDSRRHVAQYRRCVLKPNVGECRAAVGLERDADGDPIEAARSAAALLASRTDSVVLCTMGDRGILVLDHGREPILVHGHAVSGPIDTVGAGDSATAGVAAAALAGGDWAEAASIGNLVASITVQQIGTTGTATRDQVMARWRETHSS